MAVLVMFKYPAKGSKKIKREKYKVCRQAT